MTLITFKALSPSFINQKGILEYGVMFLLERASLVHIFVGDDEGNFLIFIYDEERITAS